MSSITDRINDDIKTTKVTFTPMPVGHLSIMTPDQKMYKYKPKDDIRDFEITRENGDEWRVSGAAIERTAKMTYFEHQGSLRRFQKLMEILGIEDALRICQERLGRNLRVAVVPHALLTLPLVQTPAGAR